MLTLHLGEDWGVREQEAQKTCHEAPLHGGSYIQSWETPCSGEEAGPTGSHV